MQEKNLVRGLLRFHILHRASNKPVFGLELIREFRKKGYDLSPGTLYPVLQSLAESGLLASEKTLVSGKIRKTYRATPQGDASLKWGKERVRELFGELCD